MAFEITQVQKKMSVLRLHVELELPSSNKFDFGIIEFKNYLNENCVAFLYGEMIKIISKTIEDAIIRSGILNNLFLFSNAPMIQIKCKENENLQDGKICCPYFIADSRGLEFQEIAGTNNLMLLYQGKNILELDPKNIYTFTLKKRSKLRICY